jgi:hypothetical protein
MFVCGDLCVPYLFRQRIGYYTAVEMLLHPLNCEYCQHGKLRQL